MKKNIRKIMCTALTAVAATMIAIMIPGPKSFAARDYNFVIDNPTNPYFLSVDAGDVIASGNRLYSEEYKVTLTINGGTPVVLEPGMDEENSYLFDKWYYVIDSFKDSSAQTISLELIDCPFSNALIGTKWVLSKVEQEGGYEIGDSIDGHPLTTDSLVIEFTSDRDVLIYGDYLSDPVNTKYALVPTSPSSSALLFVRVYGDRVLSFNRLGFFLSESAFSVNANTFYDYDENCLFMLVNTPNPTPAPSKPMLNTTNIDGLEFNTWEEIIENAPKLEQPKMLEVGKKNKELLHVNILGMPDRYVPAEAISAVKSSSLNGLHVFIGESDAVTFLNSGNYTNYKGIDFSHNDTFTENSRTIDFKEKGSINATVLFHSVIAPNTTGKIYKIVDGAEVLIGTAFSNDFGGICFGISDLATYVIRY